MSNIRYVIGRDSVQFSVDGIPTVIAKTHFHYLDIINALGRGDLDAVKPLLANPKQVIADALDGLLTIENNRFFFDGKPLNGALSQIILELKRDGHDISPMANLFRNLLDNPSKRAVDELYGFIKSLDCPITPDGYFIAYKMVNADFTDKYTGTMDNSPGATVKMRRNEVNEDKNDTCSDGLHFASLHYVTNGRYGRRSDGDKLIAVKINPRDVVSIPTDYNNSKGRACEYVVLRELDWNERLPVKTTGFLLLPDVTGGGVAAADDVAAVATADAAGTGAAVSKYTDDDIRKVKRLLADGLGLTAIQVETGISRRHVARIRDKEVGANITI